MIIYNFYLLFKVLLGDKKILSTGTENILYINIDISRNAFLYLLMHT